MRAFVNGGKQLYWDAGRKKIALNKILLWYYEDFDTHGRKVLNKAGAGDYLATYLPATKTANQFAEQLTANLNKRAKFALRFARSLDFFYNWQINDTRNY